MRTQSIAIGLLAAMALAGCQKPANGANGVPNAQTPNAQKAAGAKTIAAGLPVDSRFMAAAKSAGLDQTLAGPGPYTVLVPDDAAFAAPASGMAATTPQNRAQATGVLTGLILPGTILVADIDKAIDRSKGKAVIATMSGVVSATKDGGKITLTDASGHKATITKGDELYSNGVVHHIDALLTPSRPGTAPAVGKKVR